MEAARVAVVGGARTPFVFSNTDFADVSAAELGMIVMVELLAMLELSRDSVDEVLVGNIGAPPDAINIARVIALRAGLSESVSAATSNRYCASSIESIVTGSQRIALGSTLVSIAGGAESMSGVPVVFGRDMAKMYGLLMKAKSSAQKLQALSAFRPNYLKPLSGIEIGLIDPTSGMSMGETAEMIAREFDITREQQDQYAQSSHSRAIRAMDAGRFDSEIVPVHVPPAFDRTIEHDPGPRVDQKLAQLASLSPVFDRDNGSVTAGNSSRLADGAAFVCLMEEGEARSRGLAPLGFIKSSDFIGTDPRQMCLAPAYSIPRAIRRAGLQFSDIGIWEINEAFSAQVIACQRALASDSFCRESLGLDGALGEIDPAYLNVNGGAIAIGHPVGASGARLVHTALLEMKQREIKFGVVSTCAGGGQGASMVLEAEL